jgi:plasmid stability protein
MVGAFLPAGPARAEHLRKASICIHILDILSMSCEPPGMKTMTIREIPDAVYSVIRREAETNHRSLQEQVRFILDKEARIRQGAASEAAREWRLRLEGRALGDTVKEIREGRRRTC